MKAINVSNYGVVVRIEVVNTKTGDHFTSMRLWDFEEDSTVSHDYLVSSIRDFLKKYGDDFRRLLVNENRGISYVSLNPEVYVSAWDEWIAF